MLHHGPNHKHLVLIPCGGLGNRLCSVLSALRYIELDIYRSMTIKWPLTNHCSINLHDVAQLNVDYELDDKIEIPYTQQYNLVKGFKYDSIYASNFWRHDSKDTSDQVVWARSTNMIKWQLPEPICRSSVAIHCRRSDWGLNDGKVDRSIYSRHSELDRRFYKFISNHLHGDVFMASDSNESIRFFRSKIPNLIYQSKPEYPIDTNRCRRMNDEILLDLSTLSASDMILRDSASSFPLIAHIISRNKMITWERPFLRDSGRGFAFEQPITI